MQCVQTVHQHVKHAIQKLNTHDHLLTLSQGTPFWRPNTWVQLLQPIVTFMAQCFQTIGCSTEVELAEMQQNISQLKHVADTFQQQGSVSGDHLVMKGLTNLERQVSKLRACVA